MDKRNFIFFEHARGQAFNMLSALLCQPEEDVLSHDEIFKTLTMALEIVKPECIAEVEQMKQAVTQQSTQDLLIEYTKIFLGPFKAIAPPYSSIYLGSSELMSEVSVWVAEFYKQMGLGMSKEIMDLPDHIVVETEFMYYLIHHETAKLEDGKIDESKVFWEKQKEFFKLHYKSWVPQLCERIAEGSSNVFYTSLANCLLRLVNEVHIPDFPE